MSDSPDSGRRDDSLVCPQCQYELAPSGTPAPTPRPPAGTVTIHPDEPPSPTPTWPSPTPGRIGRFLVRRFLGEGSFGRVYEAEDPTLKRVVALKVAKPEQMGGPKRIERFQREARAAANLMHPNVVAVFDSGEEGGQHYIACAFVAGRSLAEVIAARRLEVREAVELVRKLAEALAYAHRSGVVHRDVKPGNVMLRDDGEPMLMDFGLAARLDETEKLTVAGQFMGTPEYTAPEQWRGQATVASDQYSLGCLLFELLTGEKPFAGSSSEHYLLLHTTQPAPSPRKYRPELPRDLENVTLKCLEKDEGRRYGDCQALADDLRRWLEGEPVTARRPGAGERLVRWARKNPAVAALSAAVLVVAVAATVLAIQANAAADLARRETNKANEAAERAEVKEEEAKREADAKAKALSSEEEERKKAVLEAEKARMARHGFMMTAALQAWRQNDLITAEAILREVPRPLQQTWEYRHLHQLCRRRALTFRGHTAGVHAVACSPDGSRIVSASEDKTLKVWDASRGQELLTLEGHTDGVRAVAYSPDGSRVVSASEDKTLKVWDAYTGRHLLTLEGHTAGVRAVAYSPDGTRIASGSHDRTLRVWDARTGRLLLQFEGRSGQGWYPVNAVAYSPDGARIALGSDVSPFGGLGNDKSLRVFDVRSGQELSPIGGGFDVKWMGKSDKQLAGEVRGVASSPDGSRVVSGSLDRPLRVWDARSGRALLTLKGHTEGVCAVAYSPDGSRVVSGGADRTLRVWDAHSGQDLLTLRGHAGSVTAVTYSPDGSRIVSGSQDGTLRVWDTRSGQDLLTLRRRESSAYGVAYSPDGSRIVSSNSDDTFKVWDARTGQEILSLEDHSPKFPRESHGVSAVDYCPDGSRVVSASHEHGTLRLWDARSGQLLLKPMGHTAGVHAVAHSPDGSRFASASEDKTLRVWDARTGKNLLALEGHTDGVNVVAYSPDGSRILSGSSDKTLRVWDAHSGGHLLELQGHTEYVVAGVFSPDGSRILSVSWDKTLRVWDARNGQNLLTLKLNMDLPNAVRFSPDGSRIFSASEDKTFRVWDTRSGQELLTLEGHTDFVGAVAFSPDGSRVVSASFDGTLRVWDAPGGQDQLTLEGHTQNVNAVAYSPDGSRVVSGSLDRTLRVWDARSGQALLTLEGHTGWVSAVAYSPDGRRIVSGCSDDQTFRVWDARTGRYLLTLEGDALGVTAVAYSPDGLQVIARTPSYAGYGKGRDIIHAWDATSGKPLRKAPTSMPSFSTSCAAHGDRRAYADGNLIRIQRLLTSDEWRHYHLHEVPIEAILRARRVREYHEAEVERTRGFDPFACVFHIDRLLALSRADVPTIPERRGSRTGGTQIQPDDRTVLLHRRADVLSAALEANPNDHLSARSLARQAVADPNTLISRISRIDPATLAKLLDGVKQSLLATLARHPHAPRDRLYGALLLRTGNARDAAVVLRAAIRNRTNADEPPIDELLLALAFTKLDRRDEASKHLKAAADWMDNGTAPQRLTAILGARPAGPLAALAAVAHVPDVRLNPLDPFTAHELYALRREVEQALAGR